MTQTLAAQALTSKSARQIRPKSFNSKALEKNLQFVACWCIIGQGENFMKQKQSRPHTNLDIEELKNLYINQKLSACKIAKMKNCSDETIRYQLKKHNIPLRNIQEANSLNTQYGINHHSYKHGLNGNGYIRTTINKKRVIIHRAVAEQVLGRPLLKKEIVHHVNEIKTDNRPENLWIFPDQIAHGKFHWYGIIHPDTIFLVDIKKSDT